MSINRDIISYFFGETKTKEEVMTLVSHLINNQIRGKSIKSGRGKSYKVKIADCRYVDLDGDSSFEHFYSVDVYLENYNAVNYFLYDDDVFEKNLNSMIEYFDISYSESGMQGNDYVNLDVQLERK